MASRMFMLAGEESGDTLGAKLMQAVVQINGPIEWIGMGGPAMHAAGLKSSEKMDQLSIIGIGDAITALPHLSRLADRVIELIFETRPEIVFSVDSKAFSVRFARRLRQRLKGQDWQPKLVHMVAPTIWAWGGWRKAAFENTFDVLLCLFPFEPGLFDDRKLKAVFVGHPHADSQPEDIEAGEDIYDLALLPGSRRSEVIHHLPIMLDTLSRLQDSHGPLKIALPAVSHLHDEILRQLQISDSGLQTMINVQRVSARQVLVRSSAMIASSGTVTLEAALCGVPGVVIYHLSPLNRLFTAMFYNRHTPVLPDLILDSQYYPFLLSPKLTAERLHQQTSSILDNLDARRAQMQKVSADLRQVLRAGEGCFVDNLAERLRQML